MTYVAPRHGVHHEQLWAVQDSGGPASALGRLVSVIAGGHAPVRSSISVASWHRKEAQQRKEEAKTGEVYVYIHTGASFSRAGYRHCSYPWR